MGEGECACASFCGLLKLEMKVRQSPVEAWRGRNHTEHFACRSNVNAEGFDCPFGPIVVAILELRMDGATQVFLKSDLASDWRCMEGIVTDAVFAMRSGTVSR